MVDVAPSGKVAVRFLRAWTEYKPAGTSGETREVDWIEYCAPGMAHIATTRDAVKRLQKNGRLWEMLSPHYDAWKKNQEAPANGIPLAAWAGVTSAQAEVLKAQGIRSVEDVAAISDSMINRVNLPGVRALKEAAQRFLAAQDNVKVEKALQEKDQQIADLQAKLENLAEMMAARLDADEAPKRGPGRPRKEAVAAE